MGLMECSASDFAAEHPLGKYTRLTGFEGNPQRAKRAERRRQTSVTAANGDPITTRSRLRRVSRSSTWARPIGLWTALPSRTPRLGVRAVRRWSDGNGADGNQPRRCRARPQRPGHQLRGADRRRPERPRRPRGRTCRVGRSVRALRSRRLQLRRPGAGRGDQPKPNLVILDWRTASAGAAGNRNRWFASDGIHLTFSGQAEVARFLRDKLIVIA